MEHYLALPYRGEIVRSEHGDYVVSFPDLPGCVTQGDDLADVGTVAMEILTGWLELALEDGQDIPVPAERPGYSGKFVVRIAKSLHRELTAAASHEGVSLNAYCRDGSRARACVAANERPLRGAVQEARRA